MPRKYTIEEIKELAGAFGVAEKHDPASTTADAATLHGIFPGNAAQFGLFSHPGVRPQRYSALVRPHSLARILQPERSDIFTEILEIMTGQTAGSGNNAADFCGNPPTPGDLKTCQQTFVFGNYYIKTRLNVVPRIGELRNRADVPADILNSAPSENPLIPDLMFRMADTRSQLQHEFFKVGVDLERSLEFNLVRGTAGTDSAADARGWFDQFAGLDSQITTGITDAVTGIACPAADSAVETFAAQIDGTDANGDNIVQKLTDVYWALQDRANSVGMAGVQHVLVMRKELFRALTEVWSCIYATYRCDTSLAGNPVNRDSVQTNQLRLEMLNGQYILIDGVQVPVVFSEGVLQESQGGNQFQSDIYVVPLSWAGQRLLRLEYFPMDNPYAQEYMSFLDADARAVLNNGLFLAASRDTGLCLEYHFASRMRLILETPFLAGRVDNVIYTFRAPIRNSNPSDTWFYADGGVSYRA